MVSEFKKSGLFKQIKIDFYCTISKSLQHTKVYYVFLRLGTIG